MVRLERPPAGEERPLVTASMFGNTTTCVERARGVVERGGYEVLVFHATGIGGRTMESLIADGYIAGSLDITTTELADYVCGGVFSAGPDRCVAASTAGIPAVIVPGCVDMANFDAIETVPEQYLERNLYQWNPNVTLLRTDVEENVRIGEILVAAINRATAPAAVLLPMRGVSMLDSEGRAVLGPRGGPGMLRHHPQRRPGRHSGPRGGPQHQRSRVCRHCSQHAAGTDAGRERIGAVQWH